MCSNALYTIKIISNFDHWKYIKPQDGKKDVARSFVGPVVGRQGDLKGKMDEKVILLENVEKYEK